MQNKKNIAFYRIGLFGDIVIALHGLYALRLLYPTYNLVVYTNHFGVCIYSSFDFIDELINTENYGDEELRVHIDSYNFESFVLTNANRRYCALLQNTNCKRIFSFLSAGSFLRDRFQTIFISRGFSRLSHYQGILRLVRSLNTKKYDSLQFDFSKIIIQPQEKHFAFIEHFFIKEGIKSNEDQKDSAVTRKIILINPFVQSAFCNLSLEGWHTLIIRLAKHYKNHIFIIPTYQGNPNFLIKENYSNVFIFHNNYDLLNLAALLKKTTLLISPSTGTSHLANNLNVPMIWLCSKFDSIRWRGDNMDSDFFVILKKPLSKLTKKDEEMAICMVINKFHQYMYSLEARAGIP